MEYQYIEQVKQGLLALKQRLEQIEKASHSGINVFEATGMYMQEIKHSAFLAWILNPQKPHGLGSAFLEKFLARLKEYRSRDGEVVNSNIIKSELDNNQDILTDEKIAVLTEKVLVDRESRIDIFIASPKAQTVIVIENKVFTTMHDEQLRRYVEQVDKHEEYRKYKKVFIYLTPQCSLLDEPEWCVFDYGEVVRLIKEIYKKLPRGNAYARIKMLLEDYMELVETNILKGNKELRALCKEIRREHKDALDLLFNYTDNGEQVAEYCKKRLEEAYDICVYRSSKLSFDFYTVKAKAYFERNGERLFDDNGICKCRNSFWATDGVVVYSCTLEKAKNAEWSAAQLKLMPIIAPNKKSGERYFAFNRTELLSEDEREQLFDNIKPILDKKLDELIVVLKQTDELYENM